MSELPNIDPALFAVPTQAALASGPPSTHAPRILLLYGSLRERSFSRLLSEEAARLLTAMGADTAGNISAFRVFRTAVRGAFSTYRSPFVSIDVLLTWGTTRFTAIAVKHEPRTVGVSNYTLRKLLVHALNMVTGFSTWPLQLASMIGFLFTLIGLGILLFVIAMRLFHGVAAPGFAFLASVIAIFSGAQLFALGIIGEYLARLHFRTMERPTYTVRSRLSGEAIKE